MPALSQSSRNDSTTLPNTQLRAALKLIEEGKLCADVLKLKESQNELLKNKIDNKDSIIANMYLRLSIASDIKETYVRDLKVYTAQNTSLAVQIMKLEKEIRKQKRKTTWSRIGTFAVVAVGGYLLLK